MTIVTKIANLGLEDDEHPEDVKKPHLFALFEPDADRRDFSDSTYTSTAPLSSSSVLRSQITNGLPFENARIRPDLDTVENMIKFAHDSIQSIQFEAKYVETVPNQSNSSHTNLLSYSTKPKTPEKRPKAERSFSSSFQMRRGFRVASSDALNRMLSNSINAIDSSENLPSLGRKPNLSSHRIKYCPSSSSLEGILRNTLKPNIQHESNDMKPAVVVQNASPFLPSSNLRSGIKNSQKAILVTKPTLPFTILSANDSACLLFELRESNIRYMDACDLFLHASKKRLLSAMNQDEVTYDANDSATKIDFSLHGSLFHIKSSNEPGFQTVSVWVRKRGQNITWVFEVIRLPTATLTITDELQINVDKGRSQEIFGFFEKCLITDLLPNLPLTVASSAKSNHQQDLCFLSSGTTTPIHSSLDSRESRRSSAANILNNVHDFLKAEIDTEEIARDPWMMAQEMIRKVKRPCFVECLGKKALAVSLLTHLSGFILLTDDCTVIAINPAFNDILTNSNVEEGESINRFIPGFSETIKCLEKLGISNNKIFSESQVRKANGLVPDSALIEERQPYLLYKDQTKLYVDIQIKIVDEPPQSDAGENRRFYALWVTYDIKIPGNLTISETDSITSDLAPAEFICEKVEATEDAQAQEYSDDDEYDVSDDEETQNPKSIETFRLVADVGSGAYGHVKLARYRCKPDKQVVVKYIVKSRILIDTWTRDRKLGTIPLEIHVMNYIRQYRHRNIVNMKCFFEDRDYFYIVMSAQGSSIDLFDYIELRKNMSEEECRAIFIQVARAVCHLHQLDIVHRDIKDENIILNRNGRVQLIDFGSANYVRKGPFDTFHGTLDYAAPEILRGELYNGKEQDVWALGILLYTLLYRENPFFNIDEIIENDVRVPYVQSEASKDLILGMLERDITRRLSVEQALAQPWLKHLQHVPSAKLQYPLTL